MWRSAVLAVLIAGLCGAAVLGRLAIGSAAPAAARPRPAYPQRIISLVPALTETCVALGLADRLVGRSSFCDFPPAVRRLPDVGALIDPDLERIVALEPDLVVVATQAADQRGTLDAAGLPYLALPNQALDDVYASIEQLGRRCGCPRAAARLSARLRDRVDRARSRAAGARPLRVLLTITASRVPMTPPWVAGPGSYLGSLVELAGHRLVPADLGAPYAELPLEHLIEVDPDAIIEVRGLAGQPDAAADPLAAWATVGRLKAVRDRRVYVLSGAQHVTPGPRFVETLDALVEALGR